MKPRFALVSAALMVALTACYALEPEVHEYIGGEYQGEGLGITDGIHVTAAFYLTIHQSGGSFDGEGTTEGVWTDETGTRSYTSEYIFEGELEASDPPRIDMWFNAGCTTNDYVGYVLPDGDIVLDGQAPITGADCELTGKVLDVVIYLERVG